MRSRNIFFSFVALIGFTSFLPGVSVAASIVSDSGRELVISGVIGPGTYRNFIAAIEREQPRVVVVEGPGGRVLEAMLIGTEIKRRGIGTRIRENQSCASACAVIFLSGRHKLLGEGSSVGLHAAANGSSRADPTGTRFMAEYLRRMGVSAALLRKIAAVAPSDIHWLSRAEERALGIKSAS